MTRITEGVYLSCLGIEYLGGASSFDNEEGRHELEMGAIGIKLPRERPNDSEN